MIVGGMTPCVSDRIAAAASTAPAALVKCPVMDLVELIGTLWAYSPKACLIASVSATSPVGVLVAWALM